jgi:hypothetical protein
LTSTIGEYFPLAYEHFRAATELKSTVAGQWRDLLDSDFLDERTNVDNDGTGRLVVAAEWPGGSQEALTKQVSDLLTSCGAVSTP